jgi:hypothetical protein
VAEHKEKQAAGIIKVIEREVFKVNVPLTVSTQEKETIQLSYRDAYFSVEVAASAKDPLKPIWALEGLLERAERSGGELAAAVYHLLRKRGIWGVVDSYLAEWPKAKERWGKYAAARQEAEFVENRLSGWKPLRKPQELSGTALAGEPFGEAR